MNSHSDDKIVESWKRNVQQWTVAVRGGQIESRELLTNAAIVEAVLDQSPGSVLDIGCGEGWLIRSLLPQVERLVGVDVIPGLVEQAKDAGGGDFHVLSYEAIACGAITESFDVVVCNFSLLGKESVEGLFGSIPSLLNPNGIFIVQTLHPITACGDLPYTDGWREGSWAGFSSDFTDPAPWYFRTLGNWMSLFSGNGFRLLEVREPVLPGAHNPASIILVATPMLTGKMKNVTT